MKAIDLKHACIERISSRKDHSLSFGVSTPEVTPEAAAAFIQLHGVNVRMLIQPLDTEADDLVEVEAGTEAKTPSQRLRSVLYVYYQKLKAKKKEGPDTFPAFYNGRMEKFIEQVKGFIEAVE